MAETAALESKRGAARPVIDRREQILDVAQEIVQRVGYANFGYRELSVAVGIRKASIHYHFPKKEDLILALVERYTANFVQSLEVIADTFSTSTERLDAYFSLFENTLAESHNEKCCLAGVMGAEIGALPVFVRDELLRFCKKNQTWLAAVIEQGIAKGAIHSSLVPKTAAQMIFSGLEGAMMLSRLHNSANYLRGVITQLRDLTFIDKEKLHRGRRRARRVG